MNEKAFEFLKKYICRDLHPDTKICRLILYTILHQLKKWTVDGKRRINFGDDKLTGLVWMKTIVVFLCRKDQSVKVLRGGHNWFIFSLIKLNETTIVSGGLDQRLVVWDLTNDTSRVFEGGHSISDIKKLNENTIVFGDGVDTLRVLDLTNSTSRVLRGKTESIFSIVKLNETTIVSGGEGILRVWDLINDTSRVLNGHLNLIYCVLKLNETTIVSASDDKTLRIWDLTKL